MAYSAENSGFIIETRAIDATSGETIDLTSSLVTLQVMKNVLDNVFPLFKFGIQTTMEIRDQLRDDDFSISLKILSYDNSNDDNNTDSGQNVTTNSVVFSGTLRVYDKPYDTTEIKKEGSSDDSDQYNQGNSSASVSYIFTAIPEYSISRNENIMNGSFKNCEISDVLVYMLSSVDQYSTMKIQNPDNRNTYQSILVPPVNLIPAIRYLDNNYSFYENHPARLFYDTNTFYMYDPFSSDCPVDNTLEIDVLDPESNAYTVENNIPQVDNDNGNIKVNYRGLPNFVSQEKLSMHNIGSYTVFYSYDENFSLLTREQEHPESYNKARYFWNPHGNKMFEDMKYETTSGTMAITIANFNSMYITPLTRVQVVSTKYSEAVGNYFIGNIVVSFTSSDKIHFTNLIALSLIKK